MNHNYKFISHFCKMSNYGNFSFCNLLSGAYFRVSRKPETQVKNYCSILEGIVQEQKIISLWTRIRTEILKIFIKAHVLQTPLIQHIKPCLESIYFFLR